MAIRTPARRRTARYAVAALAVAVMLGLPLTAPATSWAEGSGAAAAANGEPSATGSAVVETPAPSEPVTPEPVPTAPAETAAPVPTEPQPGDLVEPAPTPAPSPEPAPGDLLEPTPAPQPGDLVQPTPAPAPAPAPTDPLGTAAPASTETEGAEAAPLVVAAPEADVQGPYLHWLVSPASAGSSFDLQVRTRTGTVVAGETFWTEWSAWSATSTVADCTAACTATGDLDVDAGDFQVTQIGGQQVALDTPTAQQEYRVRAAAPPAGQFWTDSSWRTASFSGGVANLGTFSTTTNAALSCAAGSFYSLANNGLITLVTPTGGGTATTQAVGAPPSFGNSEANALGIGPGGTTMYLLERSSSNAAGISAMHYYSVSLGWQRVLLSGPSLEAARYTAGAVNLADGKYYFAAFSNGQSQSATIYSVTSQGFVTKVGQFSTQEVTQQASGDMAFDAAGNLYIAVTSSSNGNPTRVYTIGAQTLAAGNGTSLAVADFSDIATGFSEAVGAAFNSDGRLYLGSATTVRIFNPSTQTFEAGNAATGLSSTDLASCLSPATLTVSKDVVGRAAAGDQFEVSVRNAGGVTLASAKTTGSGTGIQATAGPVAAVVGNVYTFTETFTNNNAALYATSFTCVDQNGSALAVDTSTPGSGRVTIPSAGSSVACTIRNSPLTGTVTIRKVVEDASGTTRTPGVGWSVTAAVTATVPKVAVSGASTQLTGSNGTATWGLSFSSTAARATVAVAETPQSGYALQEGACIVRPIASAPYVQSFTSAAGTSLTQIAPGTRIECTFVNRQQPTRLTLVNEASGGAAAGDWSLSATPSGGTAIPFVSGTRQDVAASTYVLAATGGPATHVAGAWTCVDQGGSAVAVASASVTLAVGRQLTCTITHATAHIVLLKHIDVTMAGTLQASDFDLTAMPLDTSGGLTSTTVGGSETAGAANTFAVRPGAGYVLSEASLYAHLQLHLQQLVAGSWVDVTAAEIVAPAAGETATYRFVNGAPPALALPLTGGIGADAYTFAGLALVLLAGATALLRMRLLRRAGRLT